MVAQGNAWLGSIVYVNIAIEEGKIHLKLSFYLPLLSVSALDTCLSE